MTVNFFTVCIQGIFVTLHHLLHYITTSHSKCHPLDLFYRRADNLYNFFLQWSPEKYGKEVSPDELGFVCVEQTEPLVEVVEDFFNEPISKDWEVRDVPLNPVRRKWKSPWKENLVGPLEQNLVGPLHEKMVLPHERSDGIPVVELMLTHRINQIGSLSKNLLESLYENLVGPYEFGGPLLENLVGSHRRIIVRACDTSPVLLPLPSRLYHPW